ncbi:Gag-Pol polyprotein, partial [Harpegnathos saltator]
WSKVVGRKEKREAKMEQRTQVSNRTGKEGNKVVAKEGKKAKRKVPNTAAVTITAGKDQYKELLTEAKQKIDLTGIGIGKIKTRIGATGALVLEIPGEKRGKQADVLAEKLRKVFTDRAKVSRPQKMGELRIKRQEISTSEKEAAEGIAKVGGCEITDIKTGKIRVARNNYRTLWVQYPFLAAKRVADKETIKIGWTQVKVELLQGRPLQCYKCLERGHVQQNCTSNKDRKDNCYRCGEPGHLARDCEA